MEYLFVKTCAFNNHLNPSIPLHTPLSTNKDQKGRHLNTIFLIQQDVKQNIINVTESTFDNRAFGSRQSLSRTVYRRQSLALLIQSTALLFLPRGVQRIRHALNGQSFSKD